MELIDKAAVVAKIERRIKTNKECMLGLRNLDYYQGKVDALNDTISFIDTLEVKEFDLDFQRFAKEMDTVFALPSSKTKNTEEEPLNWEYVIAKHFFELGLKVQHDNWKVENLWKPANGDDLPEYDREVVVLLNNGMVAFGHRPPEYWDGKDIITGKVTRNYVERYDKGLWNIPNVKYWLDCSIPKEIEL